MEAVGWGFCVVNAQADALPYAGRFSTGTQPGEAMQAKTDWNTQAGDQHRPPHALPGVRRIECPDSSVESAGTVNPEDGLAAGFDSQSGRQINQRSRTMSKNTGGPAFPCIEATLTGIGSDGEERFDTEAQGGMTLRDHFAGLAMAAMIQAGKERYEDIHNFAYGFADSMLVERAA